MFIDNTLADMAINTAVSKMRVVKKPMEAHTFVSSTRQIRLASTNCPPTKFSGVRIEAKVVTHNTTKVHTIFLEWENIPRILIKKRRALHGVDIARSQASAVSKVWQFMLPAGVTAYFEMELTIIYEVMDSPVNITFMIRKLHVTSLESRVNLRMVDKQNKALNDLAIVYAKLGIVRNAPLMSDNSSGVVIRRSQNHACFTSYIP